MTPPPPPSPRLFAFAQNLSIYQLSMTGTQITDKEYVSIFNRLELYTTGYSRCTSSHELTLLFFFLPSVPFSSSGIRFETYIHAQLPLCRSLTHTHLRLLLLWHQVQDVHEAAERPIVVS